MSAKVKFYLDEHVNLAIAAGLRRRGIDVLTIQEAEMLGAADEEHLVLAFVSCISQHIYDGTK